MMWWSVVSTPSLSYGDDSGLKESRWGYGLWLENVSKFVQVVKISFCAPSSLFYRPLKINPCKFIQTVLEFTWFYFTNVHITKQTKEILESRVSKLYIFLETFLEMRKQNKIRMVSNFKTNATFLPHTLV